MSDERDEIIERVAATLQSMPIVDPDAQARVVVAIAAAREGERGRAARSPWRQSRLAWPAGALVAAALVLALVDLSTPRNPPERNRRAVSTGRTIRTIAPVSLTSTSADVPLAMAAVQLVLHAPGAKRVTVVGDFTEWDARRVSLARDSASGLWSVDVAVRPGRHVYAFVVDDTIWMRDPRALPAEDADFGRPGSLLLVGQP